MNVLTSSSHRAGQGVSQYHFGSLIHHMVLEITLGSHEGIYIYSPEYIESHEPLNLNKVYSGHTPGSHPLLFSG